jgi:hypothetical protein
VNITGSITFEEQNNNCVTLLKRQTFMNFSQEKDCIPEIKYNWFSPEAPAIRTVLPPPAATLSALKKRHFEI